MPQDSEQVKRAIAAASAAIAKACSRPLFEPTVLSDEQLEELNAEVAALLRGMECWDANVSVVGNRLVFRPTVYP